MQAGLIIVHVLFAISIIAVVLLQSGKQAGLSGAITGGAETLFGKKRGLDKFLSRITMYLATGFFLTSLLMMLY